MVNALGFSHSEFDAREPGRLCRGRERWIEPYEIPEDWEVAPICRLTISGAAFTDDSAADALRGVPHSGVDLAGLIAALFPRRTLLAFMEDGHPADIPDGADHVELYDGYRAGGRSDEVRVRWTKAVSGVREIRAILGDPPSADRVRGFALVSGEEDMEPLLDRLFLLTGMATMDSPPAQFQPAALPELLDLVKAVALIHRDKHGPALGVYSREPVKTDGRLASMCEKAEALLVPFAIPPMLARWDRALSELRSHWDEAERGAFPVPVCPEPHTWEPRRRKRDREKAESTEESLEEQTILPEGDTESDLEPPTEGETLEGETLEGETADDETADDRSTDDLDALLSMDD